MSVLRFDAQDERMSIIGWGDSDTLPLADGDLDLGDRMQFLGLPNIDFSPLAGGNFEGGVMLNLGITIS